MKRLTLKTLSYGATHIVVATCVAYALTGNWVASLTIGLVEPLVQTGVFAVHDWLWEHKREGGSQMHHPTPVFHAHHHAHS